MQKDAEATKIKNGQQIVSEIFSMRKLYESELEKDDIEEEEFTFLDHINKLSQLILNDTSFTIYTALSPERIDRWRKKRLLRWFKRHLRSLPYVLFLATITVFLITESVAFYAEDGVVTASTYLKAILTELSFIFLTGYKTQDKISKYLVGVLKGGVFALMLFVITSQTITLGTQTIGEIDSISEQVALIEKQIVEKDKEIIYYRDVKNWPSTTKQMVLEKDQLVQKLLRLKEAQAAGKTQSVSELERYKMYGRAAFRVILLLITALISKKIFSF